MDDELFTAVDRYVEALFIGEEAVLAGAVDDSQAAGLPAIHVSPVQGRLLHVLARLARAQRILEIGTFGGYSTIWLARALSTTGRLITLEYEPRHVDGMALAVVR